MKKNIYRLLAAAMGIGLTISSLAVPAMAETKTDSNVINELLSNENGQTVYVIADANGEATKSFVSTNNDNAKANDDIDNLPIKIKATYTLDGKEIDASQVAGATGDLKIRYDYENTATTSDGVHVPFIVIAATVLDSEKFEDVAVSNGKVINDGDHCAVLGMATPSLADDLGIESESLKLYDYVEIEAKVSDAKLDNVYTIVSNDIFAALDKDLDIKTDSDKKIKNVDSILSDVDELTGNIEQLIEGVEKLDEGAAALNDGIDQLSTGLTKLSKNSDSLNQGAYAVFNSLIDQVNQKIAGTGLPALTVENYSDVLSMAIAGLQAKGDARTAGALMATKGQLDSYNQFYTGLKAYTAGVNKASKGAKELSEGSSALAAGIDTLKSGVGKVDTSSLDGDNSSLTDNFKKIKKAAADYKSYTSDNAESVKFVYKLAAIK